MSIATITATSYSSPTSLATFVTTLNTAMVAAGFTVFDSQVIASVQTQIYSINLNTGASKGINYLQVSIPAPCTISAKLLSGWTVGSNLPLNAGTANASTVFSLTNLVQMNFYAINSAELKAVLITQGTLSFLLGIIRPANLEIWYSENSWNYAFLADNLAFNYSTIYGFYRSLLNPENVAGFCPSNWNSALAIQNSFNSNNRQIKPIEMFSPNNFGAFAYTSTDLVWCAGNGIVNPGLDTLNMANGATYLYLGKSSSVSSCQLAVRIS